MSDETAHMCRQKGKKSCTAVSVPILVIICSFKGLYLCFLEQKTELAYLVWFRFYNFLSFKNLKILTKNVLTAKRSKNQKNYFIHISEASKDILKIPTDLSSIGSKL